ncbi:MAG: translation initiation factor IF-3 [Candidatus Omnitrophica bacterium]|nr:translation initiation factor IF-3 [Candidatus Omnitrophota bacterium]
MKEVRVNQQIRASVVRLISSEGEQLGIVSRQQALQKAEEAGLDLVEVAHQTNPPVCRIMDFSKYKYEQEKREREMRKHRKSSHIKEIRLRPSIDEHDYQIKMRHLREFLEKGEKVRVRLLFRGREMVHQEVGRALIERLMKETEQFAKVDKLPQQVGRMITLVLASK